jgi:hypothetical protein
VSDSDLGSIVKRVTNLAERTDDQWQALYDAQQQLEELRHQAAMLADEAGDHADVRASIRRVIEHVGSGMDHARKASKRMREWAQRTGGGGATGSKGVNHGGHIAAGDVALTPVGDAQSPANHPLLVVVDWTSKSSQAQIVHLVTSKDTAPGFGATSTLARPDAFGHFGKSDNFADELADQLDHIQQLADWADTHLVLDSIEHPGEESSTAHQGMPRPPTAAEHQQNMSRTETETGQPHTPPGSTQIPAGLTVGMMGHIQLVVGVLLILAIKMSKACLAMWHRLYPPQNKNKVTESSTPPTQSVYDPSGQNTRGP